VTGVQTCALPISEILQAVARYVLALAWQLANEIP